jgi:Spy/CpxP family protein refolding chaperone
MIGNKVRAGLALLFTFVAGALAGVFFERHRADQALSALSAGEMHEAAMAELREAVDLDDRQIEQIQAVMAERQEVVQRVWEQLRPEVVNAMQEVHADIAELLRPDQRQRFNEWLIRRHEEDQEEHAPVPHR